MARHREFDEDVALDGAIGVFREHGFEGSSTQMLVDAMQIGRQSLYATFGDKWQLYCAAVLRYGIGESGAHLDALHSGTRAIDGIRAMMRRVAATASQPCLGVASIAEFGTSRADLAAIHARLAKSLRATIADRIRDAQRDGSISSAHDPACAADFLMANIAGIRLAGRNGADGTTLTALAELAVNAFR